MKNRNEIIKQLEMLGSHRKAARMLTWLILFFSVLSMIGSVFMFIFEKDLFPERYNNTDLPQQSLMQSLSDLPIQSFSELTEVLKNEPRTDKRFRLLAVNLDSIPSDLSLNQLKDVIDLFLPENYKLNVIRLLQPKITDNYSNNELEGFKRLFSLHKQSEVKDLLSKRGK